MSGIVLVFAYAGFAVLATVANLATQRVLLTAMPDALMPALAAGTIVGLLVKYALDKTWIFAGSIQTADHATRTFELYVTTGIFTTLIFWGFETAAWLIWQSHPAREAGAVAGLMLGYAIKYQLDRRYVFQTRRS